MTVDIDDAPQTLKLLDSVQEAIRLWVAEHGSPVPEWLRW